MVLVEVERKQTRKVCNNARGTIRLGCILSPPLYIQMHSVPVGGRLIQRIVPQA